MAARTIQSSFRLSWLHAWAVLTVCLTLVLLTLGSIVTTFHVGMADPIWPTYPWHLLLISWQEPKPGFIVEHSHRAAGYVVGCCAIGLAIGGLRSRDRLLGWLGLTVLMAVIVQGLLGGFRVVLDRLLGQNLALLHGFFAQVVFALMIGMAVLTSRTWTQSRADAASPRVRRWSSITLALIGCQLLLGGFVRHTYSPLGQRLHLLTAFAVVAAAVWLLKRVDEDPVADKALVFWARHLGLFVAIQVVLGVEAWMLRFAGAGGSATVQAIIRCSHVLVSFGVSASAVATALQAYRQPALTVHPPRSLVRELEVVV